MNATLKLNSTISSLLIIFALVIYSSGLLAQTKQKTVLKDFLITIEKTNDGIKLECTKGSAWKTLSYSNSDFTEVGINQFGITDTNNNISGNNSELADYDIMIKKTSNGIELRGIKGTAWVKLTFTLKVGEKQAIDQFGMTNK